jgi:hypothetical protein
MSHNKEGFIYSHSNVLKNIRILENLLNFVNLNLENRYLHICAIAQMIKYQILRVKYEVLTRKLKRLKHKGLIYIK